MRPEKIMPQDRNSLRFSSLFVVPYLERGPYLLRPSVRQMSWFLRHRRVRGVIFMTASVRCDRNETCSVNPRHPRGTSSQSAPTGVQKTKTGFSQSTNEKNDLLLKNALNWKSVLITHWGQNSCKSEPHFQDTFPPDSVFGSFNSKQCT